MEGSVLFLTWDEGTSGAGGGGRVATVVIGLSFWCYAGFTILFTLALSNLDRYQCWKLIEELESA